MGSVSSTTRTPDDDLSWIWGSNTASFLWNNVALSLIGRGESAHSNSSTLRNARLLAVLNLAIADAIIGRWKKVHISILAVHHRNFVSRHGRQCRDHCGYQLGASIRDACAP